MALNAIDGMLAKEHNLTSNFGALLNELTDVVSDSAFYLVFCAHPNISPTLVVLFTIVAIYVEFVGVSAKLINSERRFDGPFGKSDRAVFCSVIALLLAHTSLSASVYTYTFSVAILLMVLTIVNRMKKALN
jgi:CDP-diacylglycerol--glycerol-3-phosphate 3-phosphatidyltransferase